MSHPSCLPCRLTAGVAAAVGLLLSGCASTTPNYDERFGEAVRHNRQAQVIHPAPAQGSAAAEGLDGQTARAAVQRYRDSFRAPPPVINVINLGSSASQAP